MAKSGPESLVLSPNFLGCTLVSSGDQEWRLERVPRKERNEWSGHSLQEDSPFEVFELECEGVFTRFNFWLSSPQVCPDLLVGGFDHLGG